MTVAAAVLIGVLVAAHRHRSKGAVAVGRARWRRAGGLVALLFAPLALYLAVFAATAADARSGVVDAPWGVALMAVGIWALREPRHHRLFAGLAVVAAAGALGHAAGVERFFAAIGWGVGLVATWHGVGRTRTGARGHLAALAGCGAIAIGGYFLAQAYVAGAGAGMVEGVRLPPAPSGSMGALVLLALILAASAGYHLAKLQGRG